MPFLNFDNAQIYYEVAGHGTPFVMLHAGIAHNAMWDPQFDHFAKTHRVVRYDQRGFGKTTTTTKEFNRRADLRALFDHLNIEHAIVMGCSMGGGLALDFALEYPERVAALILIAPGVSGYQPSAEILKQEEEMDAAFSAGDNERGIEMEIRYWVDGPKRAPNQVDAAVREKVRAMERENLQINTEGYNSLRLTPPAIGRLRDIHAPTLIIQGDGDVSNHVELSQQLAHEIPNAELFEMANVGHLPSMEKPDEVNRIVEKFLTQIA